MGTLVVPPVEADEAKRWPSLGPQIAHFLERFAVYGPGDLRGAPYHVDDVFLAWLRRAYQVVPKGARGEGRRRFKRAVLSARKGTAKTEKAALIAIIESHPLAPARFDHWARRGEVSWWGYGYAAGEPVGRGVFDPYVPMVAYTEEQSEELAFGALRVILEESELGRAYDVGIERVVVLDDRGKAAGRVVPLAGSPNARDGARTTFQHFDETHRLYLPALVAAHQTMLNNVPKRYAADAWTLETTTAPAPGEGSVAEGTMEYAELILAGKVADPRLFFFHRQADDGHDLADPEDRLAAVIEASGPDAGWSDLETIVGSYDDPQTDKAYWERVWLNRLVRSSSAAWDPLRWAELALDLEELEPPEKTRITLGFDGAKFHDATALIGTVIATGYQWPVGIWERPPNAPDDWEVPVAEVDAAVEATFDRYRVWRMYADPPYWEEAVGRWQGLHGDRVVVPWHTWRDRQMAEAVRAYTGAINAGELSHSGDRLFADHVANARRRYLRTLDEEGAPLWTVRKERPDSPKKIDAAVAAILSWEARRAAIATGAEKKRRPGRAIGF